MVESKRYMLIASVLIGSLMPGVGTCPVSNTQPENTTAAQILAKLVPLPDNVSRTIMNPYYADPAWKLWALDPSPVTINKPHFKGTFEMPTREPRKFPRFMLRRGVSELDLEPLRQGTQAGFWDDCYMSLDNHHTRLSQLKNQFIDAGKMSTAQDVQTLLQLGVNFTSQSYADRGRAIVDDIFNNLNTERHFFFANCIRATPSHASYRDVDEDRAVDLYDGLFAHSYQSVGQSGSEVHALYKMMLAGACMPRATKNLLKKHGAYAIALLTIFKAALPYTDGQGQVLPYEHELRHRPAYSSNGTPSHAHYCSANVPYHGYDEERHLQEMMNMASALDSAPPVAIAKFLSVSVKQNGQVVSDRARVAKMVKCISLTNMRFWGGKDETLEVRIDLNPSYDLQKRPLCFKCQALYPNQKNVTILEEEPGVYLIRVKHDPKLPKGRIPVICTASNGLPLPSNPVFINFYWPDEKEVDDYFPTRGLSEDVRRKINALGLRRTPVTVNLRPIPDLGFVGDAIPCHPGQTVSIDLKAQDPEGFPVSVFGWAGQIGAIKEGRYTAKVPLDSKEKIYRVHFIFSDGTGAYAGRQLKLLVSKQKDTLPEGWAVTAIGNVQRAVNVSHEGSTLTFGKQPLESRNVPLEGTFVFQPVSKAADLMCQIPTANAGTEMALMITKTLDGFSRRAGIGFFQGKILGVFKHGEQTSSRQTYPWNGELQAESTYLRLILHDDTVAGYVSTDERIWEQVLAGTVTLSKCYAGLVFKGDPWDSRVCHWLTPSEPMLPRLTVSGKCDKEGRYANPLEITMASPDPNMVIHYTLDGSEPTAHSPLYEDPIKLNQAGRHEIRVKTFQGEQALDATVTAVYQLKP